MGDQERDPEVKAVIREETSRRDRPWVDTDAEEAQRKREQEQKEDVELVRTAIREGKGKKERVLKQLRANGVPEAVIERFQRAWDATAASAAKAKKRKK